MRGTITYLLTVLLAGSLMFVGYQNITSVSYAADSGSGGSSGSGGKTFDFAKGVQQSYVRALLAMGEQFTAVMMQQMMAVGAVLDAKYQLEVQREYDLRNNQSQKDYYPSDQMCRFGTFVRSIAHTESKADHDKLALNAMLMTRYTDKHDTSAGPGNKIDFEARMEQFRRVYCDPTDNNAGLGAFCTPKTEDQRERVNKDIDFVRTIGSPLTVDVNFVKKTNTEEEKAMQEDIVALGKNLYAPLVLEPKEVSSKSENYLNVRRLAAFQNIAHSSYTNYMAAKSKAPEDLGDKSSGAFLKALMRDFGLKNEEIIETLGEHPSYYAQMDVLTKKIYQDPDFYTNLYDKPANVDRIGVSMQAIDLMNARDHYESALRREMLISLLVEQALEKDTEATKAKFLSLLGGN